MLMGIIRTIAICFIVMFVVNYFVVLSQFLEG